jgi:DNA-directed RNA polymerase II subunit RPB2
MYVKHKKSGKTATFAKEKAETLLSDSKNDVIRMLAAAQNGVETAKQAIDFMADLGVPETATHAFLELYGYWLGDGSLMFRAYGGRDAVHFSIVKPHDVAWLMETFATLGLVEGTDFTRGSGAVGSGREHKIYVTRPSWTEFFMKEYRHKYATGNPYLRRPTTVAGRAAGARTLVVPPEAASAPEPVYDAVSNEYSSFMEPEPIKSAKWFASWVWTLNKQNARTILRGLRRADGGEASDKGVIYTSSVRFRDEMQRLCLHAGYTTHFKLMYKKGENRGTSRHGKPIVATADGWIVTYNDTVRCTEPILRQSEDIRTVEYTGRTWCVSVPHGFIIARRAIKDDSGVVVKTSRPVIMGNCMISHGTSEFLKEIMMEKSDNFQCFVCKSCGLLGTVNPKAGIFKCTSCEGVTDFAQVRVPYAYKLFLQELESMSICSRILTESHMRDIAHETGYAAPTVGSPGSPLVPAKFGGIGGAAAGGAGAKL